MSLKDICISLETAKKLVKLGIRIDSEFYWVQKSGYSFQSDWALITSTDYLKLCMEPVYDDVHDTVVIEAYPALSAEEIDLPESINTVSGLRISLVDEKYMVSYGQESFWSHKEKLCEAFAEMRLWLTENGYFYGNHWGYSDKMKEIVY